MKEVVTKHLSYYSLEVRQRWWMIIFLWNKCRKYLIQDYLELGFVHTLRCFHVTLLFSIRVIRIRCLQCSKEIIINECDMAQINAVTVTTVKSIGALILQRYMYLLNADMHLCQLHFILWNMPHATNVSLTDNTYSAGLSHDIILTMDCKWGFYLQLLDFVVCRFLLFSQLIMNLVFGLQDKPVMQQERGEIYERQCFDTTLQWSKRDRVRASEIRTCVRLLHTCECYWGVQWSRCGSDECASSCDLADRFVSLPVSPSAGYRSFWLATLQRPDKQTADKLGAIYLLMKYDTEMTRSTKEMTGWSYFAILTRIPDTSQHHTIIFQSLVAWKKWLCGRFNLASSLSNQSLSIQS